MIYQVDENKKEVEWNEIKDGHIYVGFIPFNEFKDNYQFLNIDDNTLHLCEKTSQLNQNNLISYQDYYFGLINIMNAKEIYLKKDSIAFYIFNNLFLIINIDDEDEHIFQVFKTLCLQKIEKDFSITRLVYCFLTELITKDYTYIEEIQDEIESLEETRHQNTLDFSHQVKKLGKEILLLRNYYENLIMIGEELEMNYYSLFENDDMRYFDIFTKRLQRLSDNVQMLRDLLNEVNLTHQSQEEYHLNKTMQLFTIVTTICLPLSLITGWYGMNFRHMPELEYVYSYYIVIGLSLTLVVILIYCFKKKNFF